ncbi:MAG TPA: DUF192 domain-containing protein [Verrucomicrobiae bacterium]|jgi:hypothetical protein|nr:DUF192 domain-containing protein [Verrucomicrobiae bacterium]
MNRAVFLSILLAAGAFFAGCDKNLPSPASATSETNAQPAHVYPTQAQPKLRTMKLYLGAEALDAELALTPKEEETGMMFRTNIQETDAMLFDLQVPQRASFWMKSCPESISAAYITPDGIIQEIHHLEQNDTNAVLSAREDILFVLETKEGWFARHNIGAGTLIQSEKGPLADVFRRH